MKKIKIFSMILISIFLVFLIIIKLSEKPEDILQKHLKNKYKEEFVIAYSGERSDGRSKWFEAEIYPKELVGTTREYDKYYWAKGFVEDGKGGDTYGGVLLNESANKFYLPKLKELFGKNVLPILNVEGYYEKTDFQEEMARRREFYKKDPKGNFFPISGGIYIFGQVESDEDREWYRKQIYEFVQFMKQTGTFEYVDLDIIISDERALTKGYEEVTKKLVYNDKNMTEWKKRKNEEMKSLNSEFAKMTQKELNNKLNSINKSEYLQKSSGGLLYVKLYSPKYITSQNLDDEEVKNYDKLEDINFRWEVW